MNEETVVPACVGIIMDGNRRWAKSQGLLSWEGHAEGYKKFKDVLEWAHDAGVPNVIVYAFSTENWKRSEEEVGHILNLLRLFMTSDAHELVERKIRVRFAGECERFPEDMQRSMRELEEKTASYAGRTVVVAMSYGGRAEILRAVRTLLARGVHDVDEVSFAQALYTDGIPDPDLIIRTSGEQRLSNFLPWQSTYSELFFVKTHWPAFTKEDFLEILKEYGERKRNFGA